MSIKEQIKAEIDKLYGEYKDKFHQFGDQYHLGLIDGLDMAERVIETLESEKPVPSETSGDMEEELKRWRHDHFNGERDGRFSGEYLTRESQLDIARHFAQWGAEHLRDTTKKVEGLEECHEEQIIERAKDLYPKLLPFATYICGYAFHDNDGTPKETIQKYLAFGAEWQKGQMLKDAVNGEVVKTLGGSLRVSSYIFKRDGFEFGDKVKIIIVKE